MEMRADDAVACVALHLTISQVFLREKKTPNKKQKRDRGRKVEESNVEYKRVDRKCHEWKRLRRNYSVVILRATAMRRDSDLDSNICCQPLK